MEVFAASKAATQLINSLILSFGLVILSMWICRRTRFHSLPPPIQFNPISFLQMIGSFLIYILLFPVVQILLRLVGIEEVGLKKMLNSKLSGGWFQVGAILILFIVLLAYCYMIKPATRQLVFWGGKPRSKERVVKSIRSGLLGWLLSYPWVLLIGLITSILTRLIWKTKAVDQQAVKELKSVADRPILFSVMSLLIIFFVPFVEELLFRGFLQTFLRKHFKRWWSLIVTAVIFSVMHFSMKQGVTNFQLIVTLFVLALFLGFLYEKEETIWAPFTLHAAFNATTIFLLIFRS